MTSIRTSLIRQRLNHQDYSCAKCRRRFWKQWRKNNDKPWNYVVNFYPDGGICPILCYGCHVDYGDVG